LYGGLLQISLQALALLHGRFGEEWSVCRADGLASFMIPSVSLVSDNHAIYQLFYFNTITRQQYALFEKYSLKNPKKPRWSTAYRDHFGYLEN
jgi:hypothetical protein